MPYTEYGCAGGPSPLGLLRGRRPLAKPREEVPQAKVAGAMRWIQQLWVYFMFGFGDNMMRNFHDINLSTHI
jgi:hypothetical protein